MRGRVLASLAVLTSGLLAFHTAVPNTVGNLGSLVEAFLPWLGLAVPMLLVLALLRRSATALVALLLPVAVWAHLFGGLLLPSDGDAGAPDITALQHNVSDENADPAGTAEALINAGPELIALEELTPSALPVYERALAPEYPHHAVEGTARLPQRVVRDGRGLSPGRGQAGTAGRARVHSASPGDQGDQSRSGVASLTRDARPVVGRSPAGGR